MGAYTRNYYHGKLLNNRTIAMLKVAEERLGYTLDIVQGSYHKGVGASAGTHDGGGVVDLKPYDHVHKVRVLREIGFAAWYRPALRGVWPEHIHAVAIGDKELSSAAASQVRDYYNHRNGLASHSYDDTWHPSPIPVFNYYKPLIDVSNVLKMFKAKTPVPIPGVKRIQKALNARGERLYVDGIFGPQTRAAYLKWSGGKEPNMKDLIRLGTGSFKVEK